MALQLSVATAEDAEAIATIHLAAFDANVLLHAQFPSKASLTSLYECLKQDVLETARTGNAERINLVVRDTKTNQIISFAKWDLPNITKGDHSISSTWPPKYARQDLLDEYSAKAEAGKGRVLGDAPCYRLTFVGTHPNHTRRGAGTLLTKWGLSLASKENIPVYLESTVPASFLYRKLGFITQDGFSMTLPGMGIDSSPYIYEELCMIRKWDIEDGMDRWDSSLNISSLTLDYEVGITPQLVVQAIYDRIEAYKEVQSSVWIHLQPIGDVMQAANELSKRWPDPANRPPLWGIPFSIKDNIDIFSIPTTNGCPPLTYTPTSSARIYEHLLSAGALFIGKTNMDQLATGLTGCRSPFGTLHSTFSSSHIVGGSSSGSAVSVSEGLVSFSIGTDTAGSIRIPALFNGVVGFKPTKGTVSARGVAPACLHHDCVSFLAVTAEDAEIVWKICEGYDELDYFAKPPPFTLHSRISSSSSSSSNPNPPFKFATPPPPALEICSPIYLQQFERVITALASAGNRRIELNWTPFALANKLLYSGPFTLERLTTLPSNWFASNLSLLHPTTRSVFTSALSHPQTSALDLFHDLHKQAQYVRLVSNMLRPSQKTSQKTSQKEDPLTLLIVPTAPFHPTLSAVAADPLGINAQLGEFAHFANVLDLVAIAIPCGFYETVENGNGTRTRMPFGVTLLAGTGCDGELLEVAKGLEEVLGDLE